MNQQSVTKESAMAKYYSSEACVRIAMMLCKFLVAMDTQKIFQLKNITETPSFVL